MEAIDLNLSTEYDSHGNPVHYIARVAPGLHLGDHVEVWMTYDYSKRIVDAHCIAMRFQNGSEKIFDKEAWNSGT